MSGVFFDSNVLLYTLARDDARGPIAIDLVAQGGSIERRRDDEGVKERELIALGEGERCFDAGCTTLLSVDLHDGLIVADRLTVHNPFRGV